MAKSKRRPNPNRATIGSVVTIVRTGHFRTPCYSVNADGPFSHVVPEGTEALVEALQSPSEPHLKVVSFNLDGKNVEIEICDNDFELISK